MVHIFRTGAWEEIGDQCAIDWRVLDCDGPARGSDTICQCAPTLQETLFAAAASPDEAGSALFLGDDNYAALPPMILGDSICVSAWVRFSTQLWDASATSRRQSDDDMGVALFSSFRSDECGDTDPCRNSDADELDRGGWFAVGNDVEAKRPADLWTANTIYDQSTAGLFWEDARDAWMMVTVSVSGREVSVYLAGELRGEGLLTTRLPRMLRHHIYVGAAHHVPFQQKAGGISLGIADFRLYDRSLSSSEVSALFVDPASECCVSVGLKDAFGVNSLDLSAQSRQPTPWAVAIAPSEREASSSGGADPQGCVSANQAATRQLDICGEITTVSDCKGVISDGVGPYANSLDCGLRLDGFIGSTTRGFCERISQQLKEI